MAASASAAAAATSLNLSPSNRLSNNNNYSSSKVSLQRTTCSSSSSNRRLLLSSSFPLSISYSFSISNNSRLSPLNGFLLSSSSHDETVVTNDENDVLLTDDPPPPPQAEGTITEDGVSAAEDDGAAVEKEEEEESPPAASSILASLHSYKQALADNDDSKVSEIESHLKSVFEDEKLALETQLATLSEELSGAKDRVLRISADFDNFRKRTERERISLVANAQGEVVENLLPVLDNFERAKAAIKVENEKEEKINNSYQSIYKQFVEILNSLGVVPVETTGQPFDPLLHEAIMREESTEFEEGVVIQEFRKGFRIGDRLLRPSMVKVSAGPGPEDGEPVSPSGPEEAQAPGQESLEESEDVDQSEPSPADDE